MVSEIRFDDSEERLEVSDEGLEVLEERLEVLEERLEVSTSNSKSTIEVPSIEVPSTIEVPDPSTYNLLPKREMPPAWKPCTKTNIFLVLFKKAKKSTNKSRKINLNVPNKGIFS